MSQTQTESTIASKTASTGRRVAVLGSGAFKSYKVVDDVLSKFLARYPGSVIITGAEWKMSGIPSVGAEAMAVAWAKHHGVEVVSYQRKYGEREIQDKAILEDSTSMIVFWNGVSYEVMDIMCAAYDAGRRVHVYMSDGSYKLFDMSMVIHPPTDDTPVPRGSVIVRPYEILDESNDADVIDEHLVENDSLMGRCVICREWRTMSDDGRFCTECTKVLGAITKYEEEKREQKVIGEPNLFQDVKALDTLVSKRKHAQPKVKICAIQGCGATTNGKSFLCEKHLGVDMTGEKDA